MLLQSSTQGGAITESIDRQRLHDVTSVFSYLSAACDSNYLGKGL